MKALATKSVFYDSKQYQAGDIIECNERDFEKILKPLGCDEFKEVKKSEKRTTEKKKIVQRDGTRE